MIEMVTQYSLTKLKLKQLTLFFSRSCWFCSFLHCLNECVTQRADVPAPLYVLHELVFVFAARTTLNTWRRLSVKTKWKNHCESSCVCFIDGSDSHNDRCLKHQKLQESPLISYLQFGKRFRRFFLRLTQNCIF